MKTVPCPCCEKELYFEATNCVNCGYKSELENKKEFLQGYRTVISILLGFSSAILTELITIDPSKHGVIFYYSLCATWGISALVSLYSLLVCQILLLKKICVGLLTKSSVNDFLEKKLSQLIACFMIASSSMGVGIILLNFAYSCWHGSVSIILVVFGLFIILHLSFTTPKE